MVKLIGPTYVSVTVPDNASKSVSASPGRYRIKVRYGTEGSYRYVTGEEFEVNETATTRSMITITLHAVSDGNYETAPIEAAEFEREQQKHDSEAPFEREQQHGDSEAPFEREQQKDDSEAPKPEESSTAWGGQRWALVIGIGDHPSLGRLTTCRADAQGLADVLARKGGYRPDKVMLLVDGDAAGKVPTEAAIRGRLELMAQLTEPGDTILVFFSGHGVTKDGSGYLVPLDGDADHAIGLDWIKSQLAGSKASCKVVILDACHWSTAAKAVVGISPSVVGGAAELSILLSNGENEQSYPDESTGRSAFSGTLVSGLEGAADSNSDRLITEGELFEYVKGAMRSWCVRTGKKQVPQGYGQNDTSGVVAALPRIGGTGGRPDGEPKSGPGASAALRKAEEAALKRLEEELRAGDATSNLGSKGKAACERVVDLLKNRQELLKTHVEQSPAVRKVDEEIASAQSDLPELVGRLKAKIDEVSGTCKSLAVEYKAAHPEMLRLAEQKEVLIRQLYAVAGVMRDEDRRNAAIVPRVPPGFKAGAGTTFEPYTGTGWAKDVVHEKTGIEMVFIPAGDFDMGTPPNETDRHSDEGPVHRVRITKPLYLGKCEVTNGQYRKYEAGHEGEPQFGLGLNGDDQPVGYMAWEDAKGFCNWAGGGLRLPTEAEWEYACRAGTKTRFWWGQSERETGRYGNVGDHTLKRQFVQHLAPFLPADNASLSRMIIDTDDGYAVAAPVGRYAGNPWGLHDMIGNASEWCEDWYGEGYYAESPLEDPQGPVAGYERVMRGGDWCLSDAGSGSRTCLRPRTTFFCEGFRVALRLDMLSDAVVTADDDSGRSALAGQPSANAAAASGTPTDAAIEAASSLRVPVGFRAKVGTTAEPYTNTGWAKEVIHEKTGIEMVFVPAGEFNMGTPSHEVDRESDEGPVHRVRISKPFYMGKYEVTQGQWRKVTRRYPSHFDGDMNPVEQVSWDDCKGFLRKAGDGLRLPTEAEWEYACRAGTQTAYSYGDTFRDPDGRTPGVMTTRPVGQESVNAWGLCGMHSNVREWCEDWYDKGYYARSPREDPRGPESGEARVVRGGRDGYRELFSRSGDRYYHAPRDFSSFIGVRLVRGLQ